MDILILIVLGSVAGLISYKLYQQHKTPRCGHSCATCKHQCAVQAQSQPTPKEEDDTCGQS